MNWRRTETVLIVLIALHSLVIGALLLFFTRWGLAFGGWNDAAPLFFPRQAGAFHVVVAAGYLIEWWRFRSVSLLVTAKSCAAVFLFGVTVLTEVPWLVPVSGIGDAAMLGAVLWVRRKAQKQLSTPIPRVEDSRR